jgi:hypothetical protein
MYGVLSIGCASIFYVIAGISCLKQKDYPHALMWLSYASANVGLMWYEINKLTSNLPH